MADYNLQLKIKQSYMTFFDWILYYYFLILKLNLSLALYKKMYIVHVNKNTRCKKELNPSSVLFG